MYYISMQQFFAVPGFGPTKQIELITRQRDQWETFYTTLGAFLQKAFPNAAAEAVEFMGAAMAMNTVNAAASIAELQESAARHGNARITPEMLEELGQTRDKVEAEIEGVRAACEKIPSELRGIMEITALKPLEQQLEQIDRQIAYFQKALLGDVDISDPPSFLIPAGLPPVRGV